MGFMVTSSGMDMTAVKYWHITGHFSRSVKDTYLLCKKQTLKGVLVHHLIGDMSIRWNSTCAMPEHLVE
ncbi:UNVERIFIED_CONTAM: hypothetical protein K2H54_052504 [Gekko kuhli]